MILYIPTPNLPASYIHEETEWYLATSPTFDPTTIVVESLNNTVDLTSISLDYDMLPGVKYYAKARIICNKSIFESDVSIIEASDFIKIAFEHPIPSVVTKPTLTIDKPNEDVPASLFRVTTTSLSTTSNATLESTSYIIEELDGTPVYSKLESKDNLLTKLFDDVILEDNKVYILKVTHNSSSNDSSEFAEEILVVKDVSEIVVSSNLTNVDVGNGFNLIVDPINNFNHMNVEVMATGMGDAERVYGPVSVYGLTSIIPNSIFTSVNTNKFILKVTVYRNDGTIIGTRYNKLIVTNN